MRILRYRGGYKYQCVGDFHFQTAIYGLEIRTQFIRLSKTGLLTIVDGYACDGPSGPTIDTPIFIYAAFVHDALYQLTRMGELPFLNWRKCDYELKRAVLLKLKELRDESTRWEKFKSDVHEKAWKARLIWIMRGLKKADGRAADPRRLKEIYAI